MPLPYPVPRQPPCPTNDWQAEAAAEEGDQKYHQTAALGRNAAKNPNHASDNNPQNEPNNRQYDKHYSTPWRSIEALNSIIEPRRAHKKVNQKCPWLTTESNAQATSAAHVCISPPRHPSPEQLAQFRDEGPIARGNPTPGLLNIALHNLDIGFRPQPLDVIIRDFIGV